MTPIEKHLSGQPEVMKKLHIDFIMLKKSDCDDNKKWRMTKTAKMGHEHKAQGSLGSLHLDHGQRNKGHVHRQNCTQVGNKNHGLLQSHLDEEAPVQAGLRAGRRPHS
jgi:hypothetical protein